MCKGVNGSAFDAGFRLRRINIDNRELWFVNRGSFLRLRSGQGFVVREA